MSLASNVLCCAIEDDNGNLGNNVTYTRHRAHIHTLNNVQGDHIFYCCSDRLFETVFFCLHFFTSILIIVNFEERQRILLVEKDSQDWNINSCMHCQDRANKFSVAANYECNPPKLAWFVLVCPFYELSGWLEGNTAVPLYCARVELAFWLAHWCSIA